MAKYLDKDGLEQFAAGFKEQIEGVIERSTGILWSAQDISCFAQLLAHIKYDSASAGAIAEELLESLANKELDQGWSREQVNLLDSLLSHVKYTDSDGGEYADQLIASLTGRPIT